MQTRAGEEETRRAHIPEIAGSNPAPATVFGRAVIAAVWALAIATAIWGAMVWVIDIEGDRRCARGEWKGERLCPAFRAEGRW